MGNAICTVSGFIASVRTGTTKNGNPFLSISLCCGKSKKDEATGQYDNRNQQWWSLVAYDEYADVLKKQELKKNDAIIAKVTDPRARVFHNDKTQKYEAVIEARLWNFSVSRAFWYKKNESQGGSYPQSPDYSDMASMEESGYGAQDGPEIPF